MIPFLMVTSRVTEIDGTCTQVIDGYDATTLNTDANMELFFNELKPVSVQFTGAIKRMKEKSETKAFDQIRDDAIDALYYLLMSFAHHPDAAIKDAALYLLEIFENYGLEMKTESLTRESSLLNSLLADYGKQKAQNAIAAVPQCATYVAALQTAQDNFESNRLSFEEAQAQEGTMENATKIKKEVVDIINKKIVAYLNVMAQINDATYGPYARTLAQIIEANNEVVRKRRNKGDEPEEDIT